VWIKYAGDDDDWNGNIPAECTNADGTAYIYSSTATGNCDDEAHDRWEAIQENSHIVAPFCDLFLAVDTGAYVCVSLHSCVPEPGQPCSSYGYSVEHSAKPCRSSGALGPNSSGLHGVRAQRFRAAPWADLSPLHHRHLDGAV
jgi:hypothetical protein